MEVELVECGNCESTIFTEVIQFTKVSAVVSQTGKAGIAPVGSTFICMNCGTDISDSEAVKEITEEKSELIV